MAWDELEKVWFSIADGIREGVAKPLSRVSVRSYNIRQDRQRARRAYITLKRAYQSAQLAEQLKRDQFADAITAAAFAQCRISTDTTLFEPLSNAVYYLLEAETAFQEPTTHDLDTAGPAELARIAAEAERSAHILSSREAYQVLYDTLLTYVQRHLETLPEAVRSTLSGDANTPRVPARFIELAQGPHAFIQSLLSLFMANSRVETHDLFASIRHSLFSLAAFASGYDPENVPVGTKLSWPQDRTKEPIAQILEDYIGNTPLIEGLTAPIELALPIQSRLEHSHILGGTGHGKTQCLQYLLYQDLQQAKQSTTSIVVIDSQGDLINKIMAIKLFEPADSSSLAAKLILIDPSDIDHPPALNLFDPGLERMAHYSPRQRELVFNSLVDIYGRFFGKLLATELTGRQETVFRYLARLMLTIEGATIHTLIALMDDVAPFQAQIETLDKTARRFFEQEFSGSSFRATRNQIKQRLYAVLSIPTFDRLFSAPRSKINFFDALNDGSIVLVNTSKDLLKKDGTAILGRFLLALIEHAIMERSIIPEAERTPTWLYVDEAQDYFDETIETMLVQARKYKCGLILAHQNLSQLDKRLKAVFMGNTSIKLVGGVTEEDAKALDADMRTSADFLLSMQKRAQVSEFALSVRNLTPQALKVDIPLGYFESQPTLSEEQQEQLLELNRKRVSYVPEEAAAEDDTVEPDKELAETSASHRDIQQRIKQAAQQCGFAAVIEEVIADGQGRIDIALRRDDISIAIEVSVTGKPEYELHNVRKCLAAGYQAVWVISPDIEKLAELRDFIRAALQSSEQKQVSFLSEADIIVRLQELQPPEPVGQSLVLGYEVHTSMVQIDPAEAEHRKERLVRLLSNLTGART